MVYESIETEVNQSEDEDAVERPVLIRKAPTSGKSKQKKLSSFFNKKDGSNMSDEDSS
jgi:hypothetical protein